MTDSGKKPPLSHGPFNQSHRKSVGHLPLFDPNAGVVVAEPPGEGEGFWAGGPSAIFDAEKDRFLLSYRLRTQLRDHGRAGRGGETVVAESTDGSSGTAFKKIWSAPKEAFDALSIEKSCLMKDLEGRYRLYVSYSSVHDYRWRIDVMEADSPEGFDPQRRVNVLSPENTGTEGVKDPVIFIVGGMWHLYANMAPRPVTGDYARFDRMHKEGNAFVSGELACPTGLATSADGIQFNWQGQVIPCGQGWDRYMARISALVYTPPVFTAIYDGRPNSGANYADRPGLAITTDLRTFHKLDHGHGLLSSPHGRGTLRYIDAVVLGKRLHYFYEMARPDGAHELRTAVVELKA